LTYGSSSERAKHLPRYYGRTARTARRGSLTPTKPPTEGLHRYGRPSVRRVARSETGHSAGRTGAACRRPSAGLCWGKWFRCDSWWQLL